MPKPLSNDFRGDCQHIGHDIARTVCDPRDFPNPHAKMLRHTFDLLSALVVEGLITDEDDPAGVVAGTIGLLEEKIANTRYRLRPHRK